MASGDSNGLIIIWQYQDEKYVSLRQIQPYNDWIRSIVFHSTLNQIIFGGDDKKLMCLDLSGEET